MDRVGLSTAPLSFRNELSKQIAKERESHPDWHKNNLEYDLRTTQWILEKVRKDVPYRTMLYQALCNNVFQKIDVFTILSGDTWDCTWRYAGNIIAHMVQAGDYLEYYGTGEEGLVTDEVREDLLKLGWRVLYNNGIKEIEF